MKTNTDLFANLYHKPRAQKSKVKALLDGKRLPLDVADLLQTAFNHYWKNEDEAAAFYIIELCEAVRKREIDMQSGYRVSAENSVSVTSLESG